jgi:hypothetical protein
LAVLLRCAAIFAGRSIRVREWVKLVARLSTRVFPEADRFLGLPYS